MGPLQTEHSAAEAEEILLDDLLSDNALILFPKSHSKVSETEVQRNCFRRISG
jgi:hypothetical protein